MLLISVSLIFELEEQDFLVKEFFRAYIYYLKAGLHLIACSSDQNDLLFIIVLIAANRRKS